MLEKFKQDISSDFSSELIVQKYLTDGDSFFFREFFPNEEFEFKKGLADVLYIHIRDIAIVSDSLFEYFLKDIYLKTNKYRTIPDGWSEKTEKNRKSFSYYALKG